MLLSMYLFFVYIANENDKKKIIKLAFNANSDIQSCETLSISSAETKLLTSKQ